MFYFTEGAVFPDNWDKPQYTTKAISSATILDIEGKAVELFTPTTEAFILVLCKSNWKKWHAQGRFKKESGNWKTKIPKLKTKKEREDGQVDPPEVEEMHKALYSDRNSGQNPFGSFKPVGIQKYLGYVTAIKKNRKARPDEIAEWDKKLLALVRESSELTGKVAKDDKKLTPGEGPANKKTKVKYSLLDVNDEEVEEDAGEGANPAAESFIDSDAEEDEEDDE